MSLLKKFVADKTRRDVLVNTSGNYLGVFFAFAYTLLLTRILSVVDFGVLSVLLAISYVTANILDFGVTAAIYAYLPEKLKNKEESLSFIKANFVFLTFLSLASIVLLLAFIGQIDGLIFKLDVPASYYFWAAGATMFFVWQNFLLNILYATGKFFYANVAVNLSHLAKMILLFFLAWTGAVDIPSVIIVLGIIGPAVFFLIIARQIKKHLRTLFDSKLERDHIKLGYTMTYFLSTQVFNIASRLDLFIVSYFLSSVAVGHYALSQKIVLSVVTSVNSISQVLSPQFSAVKQGSEVIKLMKKSLQFMALPGLIFLLVALVPDYFYRIFFTSEFVASAPVTRLLSLSFILYGFALVPLLYFLYTVKKPQVMLFANLIFLTIVGVGNFYLIPKYELLSPALVFFIAFTVVLLFTIGSFIYDTRKFEPVKNKIP